MIADYLRSFSLAYLAPRLSAALILMRAQGMSTALWLFALAYLFSQIAVRLAPGYAPPDMGSALAVHVADIMFGFLFFLIISSLVYSLGRMAGGKGTRAQAHVIVAWHSVVTSPLAAVQQALGRQMISVGQDGEPTLAPADVDTLTANLAIISLLVSVWLLANYVTTLHRFQSVWKVTGVLVAVPMLIALLFAATAGASVPSPARGVVP